MVTNRAVEIELSNEERAQLEAWARRPTSAQALARRSRVVLLAAEGLTNTAIAERLGVYRSMVTKWRGRFAEHRLDGLLDEPRPGQPRTVTDARVEEVITKTLETKPKDATHWSTRSMAAEVGLTQSAVHRIWKAFGQTPRHVEPLRGAGHHHRPGDRLAACPSPRDRVQEVPADDRPRSSRRSQRPRRARQRLDTQDAGRQEVAAGIPGSSCTSPRRRVHG